MHSTHGFNSPIKDPIVVEVIAGLKRMLAAPSSPKEPFTPENIKSIFNITNKQSLTEIRNASLITLAYFAFLRVDELLHIQLKDITFFDSHLQLCIPKAKTDQLRQGTTVVVAKIKGNQCPVELLLLYIKVAKISLRSNLTNYLFCRIILKRGKLELYEPGKAMTYSNVWDIVKSKASQLGLDPRLYAMHSMRSGGATAAAGAGVTERLLQKHGRWACASSKDKYIKDDLSKRLRISQHLMQSE
jgi:integrase